MTWSHIPPNFLCSCNANVEHERLQASGAGNAPAEVDGLEVASPFTANVWEVGSPPLNQLLVWRACVLCWSLLRVLLYACLVFRVRHALL